MKSDLVVLAAGAETAKHSRELGCQIPIQPGKGYSITMPPPSTRAADPDDLRRVARRRHALAVGIRIGSTMEFVGYDRSINRRRIELFQRAAAEHLVEAPTGPSRKNGTAGGR